MAPWRADEESHPAVGFWRPNWSWTSARMDRPEGVAPSSPAWKAGVLLLYDGREKARMFLSPLCSLGIGDGERPPLPGAAPLRSGLRVTGPIVTRRLPPAAAFCPAARELPMANGVGGTNKKPPQSFLGLRGFQFRFRFTSCRRRLPAPGGAEPYWLGSASPWYLRDTTAIAQTGWTLSIPLERVARTSLISATSRKAHPPS